MSPHASWILVNEVLPRLHSAIPNAVRCVGSEDHKELIQDGAHMAAKMLVNAEAKGEKVTAGNVAYYTIQHLKSGRRSVAQKAGWDDIKKKFADGSFGGFGPPPGSTPGIPDYDVYANGNQRYKDPSFFQFNKGTSCGTKGSADAPGCGFSVKVCGKCVRTSILGNIMFGFVGQYANFSTDALAESVKHLKKRGGQEVDPNDPTAYKLGADLFDKLKSGGSLCDAFNALVGKSPSALHEGRKGGGYNDLQSCKPCSSKTSETRHGAEAAVVSEVIWMKHRAQGE